ncbi:acetyl-CoA carboxylase biotin carboxylase subunit [bacterium]|nr:acetyl-CoA carboxylase biotin carboxylase subunit [bacterium]
MFNKILVANRGEIALRIIRACRELDIKTVVVYSTADEHSLPVRFADEAICIGKPSPTDSYLNIPAIMSAAEIMDVDAIHPGYGFLAENPHFAEICGSCNIKFIGPSPESIRLLGDKSAAKDTMRSAGVPVIPGSEGVVENEKEALKIAKKIGYPVIIKASYGGGGRGMRVAHNDISLVSSFMTAKTEAEAAFKHGDVYMEKFIENPRHIEVQLLGDDHGNYLYLGERDCSIQRRHQKLLEEAPSPIVTPEMRKYLGEAAVKGARAAKYVNAGTIEFLLDKNNDFYFMEMNTRIQVEHPVTEMVTDIDLIKEQIRIAAGEKLRYKQEDIVINGASIECRINAEDPDNNFMPCAGEIVACNFPGGFGVRIDTHVYQGYKIPPFYDSMIAKLIVHGKTRDEAISILKRTLEEFVIEGVKTTIPLFKRIVRDKTFIESKFDTSYMEKFLK